MEVCGLSSLLHNAAAAWGRLVYRRPYTVLLTGLSIVLVFLFGIGFNVFSGRPDAPLLDLWLPPDSWRQEGSRLYGPTWGSQRLEQVIVTPADGYAFVSQDGNKTAILAAFDLFDAIQGLVAAPSESVGGVPVAATDVCYQPAAPFLATCLGFNPFDWWGQDRQKLLEDATVGLTLGAVTAAGALDGQVVERSDVFGGIVESKPGEVASLEAMMLWFFVDADPAKMVDSEYNASVFRWEEAFLNFTRDADANASIPLRVLRNTQDSLKEEIEASVAGDMTPLLSGIVLILVLAALSFVTLHPSSLRVGLLLSASMGLVIGGQMGSAGWGEKFGWILPFQGVNMVLFTTMALGIVHRCVLIRDVNTRMARFGRVDVGEVAATVLPLAVVEFLVFTPVFAASCYLSETDGIRAYLYMAVFGFPLELVGLACLDLVAVTFITSHLPERKALAAARKASVVSSESLFGGGGGGGGRGGKRESQQLLVDDAGTAPAGDGTGCLGRLSATCARAALAVSRWPFAVRALWMGLALAAVVTPAVFGVAFLVEGWTPTVQSSDLIPAQSYSSDYYKVYDNLFAPSANLPADFPVVNLDYGDPRNGPGLLAAAEVIRSSPLLNASRFRNWYAAFIEYCNASTAPFVGCAPTMEDGFPTNASFGLGILLFIADPKYQAFAADLKLDGAAWSREAKFGAVSVNGAVYTYDQQKELAGQLHELSLRATAALTGENSTAHGRASVSASALAAAPSSAVAVAASEPLIYCYNEALLYLEQWAPSSRDLWLVIIACAIGGLVGAFLLLDVWTILVALASMLGCCGAVVLFIALTGEDINLNIASVIVLVVPVVFGGILSATLAFLPARLQGWRPSLQGDAAAYVAGRVVMPALGCAFLTLGLGALPLMACSSPLNRLFLDLWEIMICSLFVAACLAVLPVSASIGTRRWETLPPGEVEFRTDHHVRTRGSPFRVLLLGGNARCRSAD